MSNPLPPRDPSTPTPDAAQLLASWQALQPEVQALPDAQVERPTKPIAALLQRCQDLSTWLQNHPQAHQDLTDTGLPEDFAPRLLTLTQALEHTQDQWSLSKSQSKSADHLDLEAQGFQTRRRLLDASHLALREDRIAQSTLAAIERGRGLDDLIEDLGALATLVEQHQTAFSSNKRFQAPQEAQAARDLAQQLRARRADYHDQARVRGLHVHNRNGAYTLLRRHLDLIRRAARFAFRDDQITSQHLARLGLV